MPLIAISRDPRYSKSEADRAILLAVVHCLEQQGQDVVVMSEREFQKSRAEGECIFGMYRDEETLKVLDKMQERGVRVIPTPEAIRHARRESHIPLLMKAGIPMPPIGNVGFPCWLKKAHGWTEATSDVIFCKQQFPADIDLHDYMIQKHIDGNLVKFYGVAGTDFFYPSDNELLRDIATRGAESLSLPVYGGDAIVTPNHRIYVIDFNDWPSFAPCREEAAKAIAQIIVR